MKNRESRHRGLHIRLLRRIRSAGGALSAVRLKLNRRLITGVLLFIGGAAVGSLMSLTPPSPESDRAQTPAAVTAETDLQKLAVEEDYLDSANYTAADDVAADIATDVSDPRDMPEEPELTRREVRIKRGQGMMDVLVKSGADRRDAYQAIKALSRHFDMRKLQIGQMLEAAYDPQARLVGLNMQKDFDHMIRVRRTEEGFTSRLDQLSSLRTTRHVEGVIDDSLFLSAYREGLPNSVIVDLIRIFSYDVDFQREIRKGDKFEIFYERKISEDGRRAEEGHILFAQLTLSGKPVALYRYQPKGALFADYFHKDGRSAKKALMKTPIEGARLSSYYGKRKHPVLGYTRMHKGLDFGAPTGTPIMAAGDGVVERASRYGSYGNYVRIRHNGTYKTAYAHLSKYGRGVKAGKRVKQGQIIGYVGATGRVTARHLHYEVLVNGKQVNPLRLKIPTGITLKGPDRQKFATLAGDVDSQVTRRKKNILLTWNQEVAFHQAAPAETPLILPAP